MQKYFSRFFPQKKLSILPRKEIDVALNENASACSILKICTGKYLAYNIFGKNIKIRRFLLCLRSLLRIHVPSKNVPTAEVNYLAFLLSLSLSSPLCAFQGITVDYIIRNTLPEGFFCSRLRMKRSERTYFFVGAK